MPIAAPSGTVFSEGDVELIRLLGDIGFIKYSKKPFPLKSGVKSHVYVYGREDLTTNVNALWAIGEKVVQTAEAVMRRERDTRQALFVGLPTAGTPLAQAAAMVDWVKGYFLTPSAFMQMRSIRKLTHGVHESWLIGKPDMTKQRLFSVDNVATDGGTKFEMGDRFAEDSIDPLTIDNIILVDRQQGAVRRMIEHGYKKPIVIFNLLDLTFVFGQQGTWPTEAVAQVEKEIAEHQFA